MYNPIGFCLNDFDVSYNPDTKLYELIHLQGPPISTDIYDATRLETSYGLALSSDLINWTAQPQIFGIQEGENLFDNSAIWTMQTIYTQDRRKRLMFYTGVSREQYFQQNIGVAQYDTQNKSWSRLQDTPVLSADLRYYQTDGFMAWRDPYVIYDDEKNHYVMFIAACDKRYDPHQNGCIAYATSADLQHWDIHPPLISPQCYNELECPVPYKKNGVYYMLVSVGDTRQTHVWQADNLYGPYTEIDRLTAPHHYAPRIIPHQGQDMVLHTQWVERPNAEGQMIWSRGYLDDPKILAQRDDGVLFLTGKNANPVHDAITV